MSNTLTQSNATLSARLSDELLAKQREAQREHDVRAAVAAAFDAQMVSMGVDKPTLPHLLVVHGDHTTLLFKAPDAQAVLKILGQFDSAQLDKLRGDSFSGFHRAGATPTSYGANPERRPAGRVLLRFDPLVGHATGMKVEAKSSLGEHQVDISIEVPPDFSYLPRPQARITESAGRVIRIEEARIVAGQKVAFPKGITQMRYRANGPDSWPTMVVYSMGEECAVTEYLNDIAAAQQAAYDAEYRRYLLAKLGVEPRRGEAYNWGEKGLRPGTPAQYAVLNSADALALRTLAEKYWVHYCRDHDVDPGTDACSGRVKTSFDHYTWAKHILAEAGLLEDLALPCVVKGQVRGYVYGTQWLSVEQAKLAQANREAGIFVNFGHI